jgi:Cu/Ag efflux protein CusF
LRALTAVALTNAVLLLGGAAAGWQLWRSAGGPADAQAVTWGGPEREWHDLSGVVRAVLPELGIVVLTHADIPGYMPGMTMGFRVVGTKIPEGLSVGDAVRFTVRGAPPLVVLTAIEKEEAP